LETKALFDMLDDVEQELRTLEEEELTRADRTRILERVETGLKEIEETLKPRREKKFSFWVFYCSSSFTLTLFSKGWY